MAAWSPPGHRAQRPTQRDGQMRKAHPRGWPARSPPSSAQGREIRVILLAGTTGTSRLPHHRSITTLLGQGTAVSDSGRQDSRQATDLDIWGRGRPSKLGLAPLRDKLKLERATFSCCVWA